MDDEQLDTSPVGEYATARLLQGRHFVVVGAGQGMGRQVCHALAQLGAGRVLCADISVRRANAVAEEIGIGVPWHGDVSDASSARQLVAQAAESLGHVDGLVDIVGRATFADFSDLTPEFWADEVAVNLEQAVWISQGIAQLMRPRRTGSIVFISSVSGLHGAPRHAAYGMAKSALISWTKSLAVEIGPDGVRANTVAPGTVLTPRMEQVWDEERRSLVAGNAPMGRLGATSDIANAVTFLLADSAAYVTGQTIVVDGGVGSKFPYSVSVPGS